MLFKLNYPEGEVRGQSRDFPTGYIRLAQIHDTAILYYSDNQNENIRITTTIGLLKWYLMAHPLPISEFTFCSTSRQSNYSLYI
jgi:hypothetical protein